eukprot:9099312-Lingulodinium_polyedra.AAC.1
MAWLLNAKSAARTHDFDARLVPYGTIADVLGQAAASVEEAAPCAAGFQWDSTAKQQARPPAA